jgi:bifunctional non-homologous end joining protein LigD
MALEEYNKKRDFRKTREPRGKLERTGKSRFVIQRHDARRLHFDLRLEIDGVLKSWAVPKGPSLNPRDKRLAVETEDHPLKYLDFEGTIPKGNYGAGEMEIWDSGTFQSSSEASPSKMYADGDLKLTFFGTKIRGEFALVRTRLDGQKTQWLLIKKKDRFASDLDYDADLHRTPLKEHAEEPAQGELTLDSSISPMLAENGKKEDLDKASGWLHEIKWDGYRMVTHTSGTSAIGYSRNGLSYEAKFPEILEALSQVPHSTILDGEVVALDRKGIPQFQWLQYYEREPIGELKYMVFDLLFLDGHSLIHLPLKDRKELLEELLTDIPGVSYSEHVAGNGKGFYKKTVASGYEGIISKKADSTYLPGTRSANWLKIKPMASIETVVCGYTLSDSRPFASLILGMYDRGQLRYIGNCGTGFTLGQQRRMLSEFKKISQKKSPFPDSIELKGRSPKWLKPILVAEVTFSDWTRDKRLRHPVFKGLRQDKTPHELRLDDGKKDVAQTAPSLEDGLEINGKTVAVTNLDKILWPGEGITKYQLIDYYLNISEYILPFLKDRPQNLHRHPNGIKKPGFYQKDTPDYVPDWIATVELHAESAQRDISYLLCQNEETLIYLANLACIELNPWNSRVGSLDRPDYLVIDLDPSIKNSFSDVVEVALEFKNLLDQLDVKGYCKTSGASGLHIYLPLGAAYSYEEARNFCKLLCHIVQERLPKLTTLERRIKDRNGRMYLDYLQNREDQTLAAPYCVRPKPLATVSTPLHWQEVNSKLDKNDFTISTVMDRVRKYPKLFAEVLGKGVDIEGAIAKISEMQ